MPSTMLMLVAIGLVWFQLLLSSAMWIEDRRADIAIIESKGYEYHETPADRIAEFLIGAKIR